MAKSALKERARPAPARPQLVDLIPIERLFKLPGWEFLKSEGQEHFVSRLVSFKLATSNIEKGLYLNDVRAYSAGNFTVWLDELKDVLGVSSRTAFRYIADYENILTLVPRIVIEAMFHDKIPLTRSNRQEPLGEFRAAYDALKKQGYSPPNSDATLEEALDYVRLLERERIRIHLNAEQIIKAQRRRASLGDPNAVFYKSSDPQYMLNRIVTLAKSARRHMPLSEQAEFFESAVGYMMTIFGMSKAYTLPIPIPVDIDRPNGRPTGV